MEVLLDTFVTSTLALPAAPIVTVTENSFNGHFPIDLIALFCETMSQQPVSQKREYCYYSTLILLRI